MVHLNMEPESGVYKKIVAQAATWAAMGHSVAIFCVTRNARIAHALKRESLFETYTSMYHPGYFGIVDRLIAIRRLVKMVILWSPNVVYTRQDLYYPPMEMLARRVPLVKEINSNEVEELRLYSKSQLAYHKLTRKRIDRWVAGFVFVSREIAELPYYQSNYKEIPKIVIGNGVNMSVLPHLPPPSINKPTLVFVGQPAIWHGVDKILDMAKLFPDWEFHLIGYSQKDLGTALTNVYTYGVMEFDSYFPIISRAHVGIGTLALHRKNMQEASPLKVREYLALGLPVIIGYKDTDFPNGAPFLLELSNAEKSIQIYANEIKSFVEAWMGRRVPREAVTFLDYKRKEKQRIEFFEKVMEYWKIHGC